MTRTIQLLRGTTAQNAAFTGASGEVTVDTQTHELRVHDGSTVGGHIIYTKSDVDTALSSKADVATTLAGYGITDGANTDLSNLTNTGKANVSKQGTYDSGETYSVGTVGEAIQNKANVALDNLTSAGVSKLGATVCGANGLIFNCGTDPVIGTGHADVYLYKNGLAVIEFCLQITTAGVSSSEFSFGLNRDALHNANNNIPLITPVSGVCTYFDAGTDVVSGLTGYAGVLQGGLQFWRPCRVYDTLGNVGGWPASSFPIGTRIIGTVYGTYTV